MALTLCPPKAAGYGQLFQLVTFKSATRGLFLKSQLDKSGINMEVAQKQRSNVPVAHGKLEKYFFHILLSRGIISSLAQEKWKMEI